MKLFKPSDFVRGETEEGYNYHHCVMGNGIEIQVESLSWGWQIGVYNIHGRLLRQTKQPMLIDLAGNANYDLSHELMLMEVSKVYALSLEHDKQILVKSA